MRSSSFVLLLLYVRESVFLFKIMGEISAVGLERKQPAPFTAPMSALCRITPQFSGGALPFEAALSNARQAHNEMARLLRACDDV